MSSSPGARRRKPTLEDRLIARILGRSLDRELAAGVSVGLSRAHAARTGQLTSRRMRRAVANSLDRLIERSELPASRIQITAVPSRAQIRNAKGLLHATAARLRSAEPLDARGIAHLKILLSDRAGPCYAADDAGALTIALHDASGSLDARS